MGSRWYAGRLEAKGKFAMKKGLAYGLICCALASTAVQAQVSQAYLFSTWTSPANKTLPPFTFTGTDGVRLFLNSSAIATGQVDIASPVSVNINFAFQYLSNGGTINKGEGFAQNSPAMQARVNSEVGRLDDVGLISEGSTDAPLNIDFTSGAKVVFKKFELALPYILIAEDAGLDPLKLECDADGNFNSGAVTLFNGFNNSTLNAVLNRPDFGADDSGSDIDQIYLFRFANGLQPGYLRITEIGECDLNSTRLEIDFAGATCVPEPNTFIMVGIGIGLLSVMLHRRRDKN
jgi:hypothetical protein